MTGPGWWRRVTRHRDRPRPLVAVTAPGYDLDLRCAWCDCVLAPGTTLADCAPCRRAMPGARS